ncbi:putative phytol kinase 2, chloroplastic [Dichanthelium oligosanthes]|uniref:phytol kinase n=1 Tax=Dichanthelium oligosanthes TaxID=888268 RepID=A0A1E5W5N5_9POAL|nr:putative phytol kinase 2, chloroplastic [Dichanthelium oligosanthes]
MAAAAWPGAVAACASSPNSLLLSRPPPHAPSPASTIRRRLVLGFGTPAVAALAAAAPAAVLQDGAATLFVTTGAYALVRTFDVLTERRLVDKSLSRKIVHVLSGVLFMSSWPLFRELLRGPLYYVLVLLFSVLVFWRESPIGIVSLSMMSGGDGFADIVGRRYGSVKLPFNEKKSWIGSISMFISGFLISAIMLYYFSSLGYIHVGWAEAFGKLALVALAATVVECIPVTDVVDDNISVPLATMLVAFLLFGSNTQ